MLKKNSLYINLILLHLAIGFLVYLLPFITIVYPILIVLIGFLWIVKTGNKNEEVLYVCAYIVGVEVFLRMAGGIILYEFAKYGVMVFCIIGMFYNGISKGAFIYWIYILLLMPAVIIGADALNFSTDIRKTILFNISGPICLGIAALYTFRKEMSIKNVNNVLLFMGLPILSCVTYLFFYTPDVADALSGTASNNKLSGGFGPNQVATILGLGMFIFFSRLILDSKVKVLFITNLIIAVYITYRGMITFSRGGMLTGFIMMLVFLLYIYLNSKNKGKYKLNYFIGLIVVAMFCIWSFTSYQTEGLIDKRYANKDALGRVKKDQFTGRAELAEDEINMFIEHPVLGVGVAKAPELRSGALGFGLSHDEITRTLAEHGALGIIALMMLFFTPIFLYFDNKQNIYLFPFLIFWFLTINHAAMRTASPAFVYALALLKVKFDETPVVHRKQVIRAR
jgi:hypothetical protein